MAKALPPTADNLNAAIQDWSRSQGLSIREVRELSGSGNRTIHLLATDQTGASVDYAIRLSGESEHLGVDRIREQTILELLQDENVHAKLLHASSDYWVFEYLTSVGPASEASIGSTLRSLHRLKSDWITAQPDWTPVNTIIDYLQQVPSARDQVAPVLDQLQELPWDTAPRCLCHIDLNPGNIIQTSRGVRLIDWEYARVGPAEYDLAVLLETWPELDQAMLLKHYGLPVDLELLDKARLAYSIIEALWLAITNPDSQGKDLYRRLS